MMIAKSVERKTPGLPWLIPVWAVALSLAVMLGIGLAHPSSSAATVSTVAAAASGTLQTSALTPDCDLAWRDVSSPNVGSGRNILTGVAAVSANDVWAVGYY